MKKITHIIWMTLLVGISSKAQIDSLFQLQKLKSSIPANGHIITDYKYDQALIVGISEKDYISSWSPDFSSGTTPFLFNPTDNQLKDGSVKEITLVNSTKYFLETFSKTDSVIVFSALNQGKSSIFIKTSESESKLLFKASGRTEYFHPYLTPDGTQIFFSSNLDNSNGNFDIYVTNKLKDGWSSPVRLNPVINSIKNELFPTWYDDTLYFSSETNGQLDIFYATKSSQYKEKSKLKDPFNSEFDDFLLHKINIDTYVVNSNRRKNEDHPYLITRKKITVGEKMLLTGYLACSGNRISNIPVTLSNNLRMKMDEDITDNDGNFILRADKNIKKYHIKLDKQDAKLLDCAVLYITDKNGKVIQKIPVNKNGEFDFETIDPDEIADLPIKATEDESLLQIEINGQVYEETPGDLGRGEAVKILSDKGEMIALAYTSNEGKFKFSDLSPESKYNIKFDENSKQLKLNIIKEGEVVAVPVENNQATYERINENESIELIDDRGKNITIQKDEFFKLQNIFYPVNSSELSEIAKFQLDRFAQFIFNNDEITIELISHTDSKGSASYNLELSQKRSVSAKNYLISKGVNAERLKVYGMGEQDPLNHCVDGVTCSDEEHAVNRRTEIRIIVLE